MVEHIEHDATPEIVCPYCGYTYEVSSEFLVGNITDGKECCMKCGKAFKWCAEFDVTYSTSKVEACEELVVCDHAQTCELWNHCPHKRPHEKDKWCTEPPCREHPSAKCVLADTSNAKGDSK